MPRVKSKVSVTTKGDQGTTFLVRDHLDELLAISLVELGEVKNKYYRDNKPEDADNQKVKPVVFCRVCKVNEDGSTGTYSTRALISSTVLIDVFSNLNPEEWLTGRIIRPAAAFLWEDNSLEEDDLCDKAVESLEVTDRAVQVIQEEF